MNVSLFASKGYDIFLSGYVDQAMFLYFDKRGLVFLSANELLIWEPFVFKQQLVSACANLNACTHEF